MSDVSEDPGEARYRAPALDKGLDILEVLSDQARGLTRAEIVKALGLSPSQIYRMLERLVVRGYVSRLDGDRYALTMRMFLLATRHPPLRRLLAEAQPRMDDFARQVGQSCHLVVPGQGAGIVVAQASPMGHWEFRARLGAQLDLFSTSSGLTLLAFQDTAGIVEILGCWGVADAARQLAEVAPHLDGVRAQGARVGASGQLAGVTDISVPVPGPGGAAVAVLTCAFIDHPDTVQSHDRDAALAALQGVAQALAASEGAG